MTIWSDTIDNRAPRRRALLALLLVLPLLAAAYQIAAKKTAEALATMPFGKNWLLAAAAMPWMHALILLEIAGFIAWMLVLARIKLSAAFPLSAVSYVLVIAASWMVFHEPGNILQIMGSTAILMGAWMIARTPEP